MDNLPTRKTREVSYSMPPVRPAWSPTPSPLVNNISLERQMKEYDNLTARFRIIRGSQPLVAPPPPRTPPLGGDNALESIEEHGSNVLDNSGANDYARYFSQLASPIPSPTPLSTPNSNREVRYPSLSKYQN